ncbi:MAG: SusC/RagA family TonB-linked outer membrane protein [Prolixibacteraceae bacterium]|jgi:TonB-linked SusC/RagA family outer membrane protein|nr:SusC/RagA family TonB-linked outer membrane protein [Prolixibacteraceae bacterium]
MKNENHVWENIFSHSITKLGNALRSYALALILIASVISPAFSNAALQSKQITGKVSDSNGLTLPGVTVVEKGTTNGSITDIDGAYSIAVSSNDATLLFSFVGMETQEIAIAGKSTIDVEMSEGSIGLEEVIAIGYGSMERKNVTGAIASIKTDEIMKAPVSNVVEALRGQVSGVKVSRTSGQPGSGVDFLIRGKNSLSSGNEPLIVIDGVPNTGGNLSEINTSDIATINILKDAAAAAIYGASGANGVVLITTKSGAFGKPKFNVEASYGIVDLSMRPTMFNGDEYYQMAYAASQARGPRDVGPQDLLDAVEYENYVAGNSIDWHELMLNQGNTKNISLSFSGGTEKFHFYMNGDVYLEDGIVERSTYDRLSYRLNTDYQASDNIKIGARVQLSKSMADETGLTLGYWGGADFGSLVGNSPLGSLYNADGELMPTVTGDQFETNPFWRYRESDISRDRSRIYVNPFLELKIIDGLTYHLNAFAEERMEEYNQFYSSIYPISVLGNDPSDNKMRIQVGKTITYLWDNILNYKKTFGKHGIDATVVYGVQTLESYTINTNGEGSSTDLLKQYDMSGVPSEKTTVAYTPNQWGKEYYVGRIGYNFDERYNLTFTARNDGSSKFGDQKKYGQFISAAGAWNIDAEDFMKGVSQISYLKYRVSFGQLGNDNIGDFRYLALTQNVSYVFDNSVYTGKTTDPNVPGNSYLQWEGSNQFNTGIDFGIFDNKIIGTLDYYNILTSELLLEEKLAPHTGNQSTISNFGKTKSWGFEANINAKIIDADFKWDITANAAIDRNEIVSISRLAGSEEVTKDIENGWFVGQDIDVIYDYVFDGIYQDTPEDIALAEQMHGANWGAGKPRIKDIAGPVTDENPNGDPDGLITSDDKTFVGSPTPTWYGGIRNTFSYKGFELTVLVEAVQGVEKVNGYYGDLTGRGNQVKVDYWTPENPTNVWPRPDARGAFGDYKNAVALRDASFISIRNVSLGYTIPKKLLTNLPFKGVSVYVRGNNLKYFTDYTDSYSPEIDPWEYPITKTWTFSAKLTF